MPKVKHFKNEDCSSDDRQSEQAKLLPFLGDLLQGPAGPEGPRGPQGPPGPMGPAGPAGAAGGLDSALLVKILDLVQNQANQESRIAKLEEKSVKLDVVIETLDGIQQIVLALPDLSNLNATVQGLEETINGFPDLAALQSSVDGLQETVAGIPNTISSLNGRIDSVEAILNDFLNRIADLEENGVDLSPLQEEINNVIN